jgi:hypothetical protein
MSLLNCQLMTLSMTPAIWALQHCYAILEVKERMSVGGEGEKTTAPSNSNDEQ